MKEMKSTIYYFEDANIKKYEKYNNYTPRSEVIKAYLKEISSGKEKNNT